MQGRILGLDYGEKTIGVAISDGLCITAQSLEIIRRADEQSVKKSVARLREIIEEYQVCRIVLGYPKNMDNTEGPRCFLTARFKERLERNFKRVPVTLWDERLSTVEADRYLHGASRAQRYDVIDKMAAAVILQSYLDARCNEMPQSP